jgi:hypothetical protein
MELLVVALKTIFPTFFPTTKAEHKREKGNKYKRERKTRGPWVGFFRIIFSNSPAGNLFHFFSF